MDYDNRSPYSKVGCKSALKVNVLWSRLNALSVTFDFFGESDWGSDWTKMDNVTLYYSIIILYNLGAKPNFLKWDDKEKMVKLDRLVMYGCQIGAQVHRAGGEGGHLSPMVKAEGFHAEKKCCHVARGQMCSSSN